MNVRDPLKLRDSSSALEYLRNGASTFQQRAVQSSRRILASVQDSGKKFDDIDDDYTPPASKPLIDNTHAVAMSYALPQTAPTQRHTSTANGDTNASIGEKMSSYFGGERKASLPMYKDKPFQYPSSSRQVSWYKRRRILAVVLVVLAFVGWWFGLFSASAKAAKPEVHDVSASPKQPATEEKSTTWFGGKKVDWDARAEMVKDAFRISWAGYEKHGWGEYNLPCQLM